MENVTKAMLIATGVLMAILIMSVMTYVFSRMGSQSSDMYDEFEQVDINKFNYQFLQYEYKEKLRIQDVVSIINIAKHVNENGKMPVAVTVTINGVLGNNLQESSKNTIKNLLVTHIDDLYTCECIYRFAVDK